MAATSRAKTAAPSTARPYVGSVTVGTVPPKEAREPGARRRLNKALAPDQFRRLVAGPPGTSRPCGGPLRLRARPPGFASPCVRALPSTSPRPLGSHLMWSRSERSPHHWTGGCRPSDFDESCAGEQSHRACVDRGTAHFRGLQRVDIDRMALYSRSAVITSELHAGPQEGTADTGTSMVADDCETRDPPDAGIQVGQQPREGSITTHAGERVPWPDPAPPDWSVIDVSDDTGWHVSITYLLLQCGSVVEGPGRVDLRRAQEQLAPIPARICAAPTEHSDQVVPPLGCRGLDFDRHRPDDNAPPRQSQRTMSVRTVTESRTQKGGDVTSH